jgi:hypothetical protein
MKSSPVLLLVFNRPDTTRRLLGAIREFAPPRVYIVADGARTGVEGESQLCEEVRKVFEDIDWDCKVFRLFRDVNMGCDESIIDGINWFFDQEEQGIILEDDCIPARSFYNFCNQLLHTHKDNSEVAIISGSTYYDKPISRKYNYFLSDFYFTWGWATWRHVWKNIDWNKRYDLDIIKEKLMNTYQSNHDFVEIAYKNIKNAYGLKVPNWDGIFYINNLMQNKKAIIPSLNQVSNIGSVGTHFKHSTSQIFYGKTFDIQFPSGFETQYRQLSEVEKKELIRNYLKKYYNYTFRDRIYLLRIKMAQIIKNAFK